MPGALLEHSAERVNLRWVRATGIRQQAAARNEDLKPETCSLMPLSAELSGRFYVYVCSRIWAVKLLGG
jgi:hypothetical protein